MMFHLVDVGRGETYATINESTVRQTSRALITPKYDVQAISFIVSLVGNAEIQMKHTDSIALNH
jgi:hypothetical protein